VRAQRLAALVLGLALVAGIATAAADWHGQGRASGVVQDVDGKPVRGAKVTLRLASDASAGPPVATTDERGRWSVLGLAGDRWRLTVEAEGFISGDGSITVPESGPGATANLQLRPLEEVTPAGPENPQAVFLWIEKGNSLLAQNHPAEARAEYEKALSFLPREQKPDVLQAVARTWFLEGKPEQAVSAAKEGLRIAPDHEVLRKVLGVLLEDLGRPAEAEAFLASLAAGTAPAASEDDEAERGELPPEIAAALAAKPEVPVAGRRGRYKVAFAERSPWSTADEMLRRAGKPSREEMIRLAPRALAYELPKESFQVIVPDGEPPAAGWGLLVWISPGRYGGAGRPETLATLARHHLIWVGANASGNDRNRWDRWGLALDAAWHLQKLYAIDPSRIYVAGYSGGGRAASALTMLYPDVFRAGLMVMGIDWYRDLPVPDHPGTHWPAPFARPPRDLFKLAKERSRFVLLTGERDFNRVQTRVVRDELADDGFRTVTYLEVPAMSHYDPVPAEWLEKAYSALDGMAGASATGR
jgi:tetratricopeptide (TPR) repeat protein